MTRFSLKSICLFVYKILQWVKCVVKVLYTKRKVSFTGLTSLRSKWAECEVKWVWHPWCKWSGCFTHCRIKYGSVIPLPPRGIARTLLEAYLPYWIGSQPPVARELCILWLATVPGAGHPRLVVQSLVAPVCMPKYSWAMYWTLSCSLCIYWSVCKY